MAVLAMSECAHVVSFSECPACLHDRIAALETALAEAQESHNLVLGDWLREKSKLEQALAEQNPCPACERAGFRECHGPHVPENFMDDKIIVSRKEYAALEAALAEAHAAAIQRAQEEQR